MYLKHATLGLLLSCFFEVFSFNNKPICTVYTPDSILNQKASYKPLHIGNRMRYATCTGATWFHENYLASLNLYGEKIITYSFDEEKKEFNILQQIKNQSTRLKYPEHLTVSPDGTLLAEASASCISIYTIDLQSHLINPTPIFVLPIRGLAHNVRFTSDGTYLAYASFDNRESVCIYKVLNNPSNFNLELVYKGVNSAKLVKTKGVNFTQDNQYAVLAYALSINSSIKNTLESLLVTHKFNQNGTLGEIVCSVEGNFSIEDIAFSNNDNAIIASDQAHDMLVVYPFDPKTGQIGSNYTLIQNPEAQLSFPHGVSVSQDGKYLVATNYGDDKFNLYQID